MKPRIRLLIELTAATLVWIGLVLFERYLA
jgi:hypothetical protein